MARGHELTLDEPLALGGTDAGPNPVEMVLAALGACQAITYRIWAALMDVRLDGVRFETEATSTSRGSSVCARGCAQGSAPSGTA